MGDQGLGAFDVTRPSRWWLVMPERDFLASWIAIFLRAVV